MGGRIWIDSEPGIGSRFHFVAHFGVLYGAPVRPSPSLAAGLRVLVVDDNATNRRILEEMLTNWRMRPSTAEGATAAVALLGAACDQGDPFRLVLTDALMPDVDGFMLAAAIQADSRFSDVRLIMLTSAGLPRGGIRAAEAGFAAYLTKPAKQSELLDAIVGSFAPVPPAPPIVHQAPAKRARPLHVLVAEDNATNQKLVVALLEQRGHAVVVAPDGRDAVARSADQRFDVVLMDVQMPEMDGIEATAAIRARERATGSHVPIVAMTAHAMEGDRERCLQAGMDSYVSKPLRPDQLYAAIEGVVAARQPTNGVASRDSGAGGPAVDGDLDRDALVACFGGNRRLLREVIDAFLADSPALVDATTRAAHNRDAKGLAASAHALKGSVGLFVQTGAYDVVRRIERAAKDGRLDEAGPLSTEIEREMAKLCDRLNALREELGGR